MRLVAVSPFLLLLAACSLLPSTTRYQVRGTEVKNHRVMRLKDLVGREERNRVRQITLEHSSVEFFDEFTVGIIEIADDGSINPAQKKQAIEAVEKATKDGGMLLIFVHGWHHSARTCDRDLACFRSVLAQLRKAHKKEDVPAVVGLYIGWRGESLDQRGWNMGTLLNRKAVAERIGRTTGKEILVELNEWWLTRPTLTMITIGHSLGGAFVLQATEGKLTGGVSDIERGRSGWYSIVRTEEDREIALEQGRKAKRAELGDLVVLVNPAIEASQYAPFANDLPDKSLEGLHRAQLVAKRYPYDRQACYCCDQMPILMTVASEADTAVGRFFPVAGWLEALTTFSWRHLRSEYWRGIGHYSEQVTHRLSLTAPLPEGEIEKRKPRQVETDDCGCPMSYEGLTATKPLDLMNTATRSVFGSIVLEHDHERQYVLELTPQQSKRGWDNNAPYFVIETTRDVISEHSDIFNPVFMGFLLNFIDAYTAKANATEHCREKLQGCVSH